jgi:hypothetical protein
VRKADNLPPSCAVVTKSGNLNFLEPSGTVQACNGTALSVKTKSKLFIRRYAGVCVWPDVINWLVVITETKCVYCAVRSTFYVLPTQCIYVFCVDLRTKSDYFTVQH